MIIPPPVQIQMGPCHRPVMKKFLLRWGKLTGLMLDLYWLVVTKNNFVHTFFFHTAKEQIILSELSSNEDKPKTLFLFHFQAIADITFLTLLLGLSHLWLAADQMEDKTIFHILG